MVKLFAYCGSTPLPRDAAGLLPPWRRFRYERLRNDGAQQESLAAGLLFRAVTGLLNISENEPVRTLPAGKPVFERQTGLWFSLSHSGGCALCAVSDAPVGCDAQKVRSVKLSIARRFCPEEQAWLLSLPETEQQAALFRLWTRKEAWVKAASDDRMLGLDEYNVLSGREWSFRDYTLPEGVPAALCGRGALPDKIVSVTREELLAGFRK